MADPVSTPISVVPDAPEGAVVAGGDERWPGSSALRRLLLVAPAVFAVHNAEESATMARWARDQLPALLADVRTAVPPELLPPGGAALLDRLQPPSPLQFYWTAAVVTILSALLYWIAAARGRRSRWTMVAVWCQAIFLVNIFVPHLTATLVLWRYTPGVVTALALNLPLSWLLLRAALREGVLSGRALAIFGVSALAACAVLVGLLLVLGRVLAAMTA